MQVVVKRLATGRLNFLRERRNPVGPPRADLAALG